MMMQTIETRSYLIMTKRFDALSYRMSIGLDTIASEYTQQAFH